MSRGANQKLKLYYLGKILLEKTDEEHYLTMQEILDLLESYEVSAERKSVYSDLETLDDMGISVVGEQYGKGYRYHVVERQFELPELKLLVDAIQSSKFITEKKSNQLIKKIESLASEHDQKKLQRQVFVSGRIKTMNESIYYNVDEIHMAINSNKKIRFQYYRWTVDKNMELRHNGKYYVISPWGLSWDDENYYLIGFDSEEQKIKHFRVDKMLHISSLDEKRDGKEYLDRLDMAVYARKSFGMYGGDEQTVTLEVKNDLAGVIIDRFGKDVMMVPKGNDTFTVHVNVAVSSHFFGWIVGIGSGIKITAPENVVCQMKEMIQKLNDQYQS